MNVHQAQTSIIYAKTCGSYESLRFLRQENAVRARAFRERSRPNAARAAPPPFRLQLCSFNYRARDIGPE